MVSPTWTLGYVSIDEYAAFCSDLNLQRVMPKEGDEFYRLAISMGTWDLVAVSLKLKKII
jgi:hypothetical protein